MNNRIEINKIINMLWRRKFPNISEGYSSQYWIDNIDGYFCCKLCGEKIAIVPYDSYLDEEVSGQHAINHVKEYNLLALL